MSKPPGRPPGPPGPPGHSTILMFEKVALSSLPTPAESPAVKKAAKPPPPAHKGGDSISPSPAKSHGSFKGSPSRGGSSWEGDWNSSSSQFKDWAQHQWYH